jgi:hypothetical protein
VDGIQRRTPCVHGGEYIEYTVATEGSHMDGGDGCARHFPLSTFFCSLKFSLVCINQPQIFVAWNVLLLSSVNRATRLEGKVERYAEGGSARARGRLKEREASICRFFSFLFFLSCCLVASG